MKQPICRLFYITKAYLAKVTIATLAFLFLVANGNAQSLAISSSSESSNKEITNQQDFLGRSTPRGAVLGFIHSVAAEDYEKASEYLDLSYLPYYKRKDRSSIVRNFQRLLDNSGRLEPGNFISEASEGNTSDSLPENQDQVGFIKIGDDSSPILLEKKKVDEEVAVWRFSQITLKKLSLSVEEDSKYNINDILPNYLVESRWLGVTLAHWLFSLILIVFSYLVAWLITSVSAFLVIRATKKITFQHKSKIVATISLPIRLILGVWFFTLLIQEMGLSIILRQYFSKPTLLVIWVGLLLLVWRLIDLAATYGLWRSTQTANQGAYSAILFFRRSLKFILSAIGLIVILDSFGFDITTGLAALGIGGIALALGAQKTIENLVGSLSLIFDQPVRIGDFCKVGEITGTVEQVGMRSSRIRTVERTLVTIPNADFAAQKIENFAHRDRFRFFHLLQLSYLSSSEQIQNLVQNSKEIIATEPKVETSTSHVRLVGLFPDSINIEILAYISTRNPDEFQEIQERLLLKLIEAVTKSGLSFAKTPRETFLINAK